MMSVVCLLIGAFGFCFYFVCLGIFFKWTEMSKPKNSFKENRLVDFNVLVTRLGHLISEFRKCYC